MTKTGFTIGQVKRIYSDKFVEPAEKPKTINFEKQMERLKANSSIVEEKYETHWIWNLSKDEFGYGVSSLFGKTGYAHRASYMMFHNLTYLSSDDKVRHKCKGHRDCINPEHLEIGTEQDNAEDRKRDGTSLFGENHPNATIDNKLAKLIKDSKGQGSINDRAIKFGTTYHIVETIDNGRAWGHI